MENAIPMTLAHDSRDLDTGETVHLIRHPGSDWRINSYDWSEWPGTDGLRLSTFQVIRAGQGGEKWRLSRLTMPTPSWNDRSKMKRFRARQDTNVPQTWSGWYRSSNCGGMENDHGSDRKMRRIVDAVLAMLETLPCLK